MYSKTLLILNALSFAPLFASAATYSLTDNFIGSDFLTAFNFEAIPDPTNGRVNYVDQATALADNLTFTSSDTLILRADSTTTLSASGPGRNSVRIRSDNTYTTHVAVYVHFAYLKSIFSNACNEHCSFDIRHMPEGCGTWPAAWETLESDWPNSGEVDVVEGVNDVVPNQSTLHTSAGCTMPDGRTMTGLVHSTTRTRIYALLLTS